MEKIRTWLNLDERRWNYTDQPHAQRRVQIRKKYPQVAELEGIDPNTKYWVAMVVALQFVVAYYIKDAPAWLFWLAVYCVGGTLNHSLFLVIHEISHNLLFQSPFLNTVWLFVANLPVGVPYSVSFQKYHRLHHIYLNTAEMDPDVASVWEGRLFRHPIAKLFWLAIQPLTYAFRPLLKQPLPWTRTELVQWIVQFGVDYLVLKYMGWNSMLYLIAGTLIGGGLHPMSGHYIAEHYDWAKGYETFSYYGLGNLLGWNVGYHNEHHDFPRVPYTKLPALKKLAPDFYDDRPFHTSWVSLMWRFVTDPNLNPFARSVRPWTKPGSSKDTSSSALIRDAAAEDVGAVEDALAADKAKSE